MPVIFYIFTTQNLYCCIYFIISASLLLGAVYRDGHAVYYNRRNNCT